eukprot:766519-Hanusia_phi.AAC.1
MRRMRRMRRGSALPEGRVTKGRRWLTGTQAEEEVEVMRNQMDAERSAVSKDLQEHLKMMEEEVRGKVELVPC